VCYIHAKHHVSLRPHCGVERYSSYCHFCVLYLADHVVSMAFLERVMLMSKRILLGRVYDADIVDNLTLKHCNNSNTNPNPTYLTNTLFGSNTVQRVLSGKTMPEHCMYIFWFMEL